MGRTRLQLAISSGIITDRDELARICAVDHLERGKLHERLWASVYLEASYVLVKPGELAPGTRAFETSYPTSDQRELANLRPGQPIGPAERDRIRPSFRCRVHDGGFLVIDADLKARHPELRDALRAWLDDQVDRAAGL